MTLLFQNSNITFRYWTEKCSKSSWRSNFSEGL